MKKSRFFLVVLIVAAAFTAAANIFFDNVPTVSIVKISEQPFAEHISLSGTLEDSDYIIVSETNAVIADVLVKKGDSVAVGQTVCTVDDRATQAMAELSGQSLESSPKEIVSNRAGKVISVGVKNGEMIGEGETVVKLESGGSMQVTAMVGESNIADIKLGQKAEITGSGFKGKTYQATVIKIGETAKKVSVGNVKTVAVEVCLSVDNPDDALKSGFTAKVKIFTEDKSPILVVPYSAVLQQDEGEYVYLYNGEKAVKTSVKTGRELSDGYEIIEGLWQGDVVITSAQKIKKNNCAVNVNSEGAQ
ncbi:MAG: efflux RND transporter periplasmic adaptor subunit [Oscillospiraceae bacterium]|nr:efflux RND transporter periplasmic adaptor subunit [Oscillospiraceae bacterium]